MAFDPNELMKDRITDIGPPKYDKFFPPVVKENYGKWKYHEILQPGVLVHVSETGAELYSVRIGSARLISVDLIRESVTLRISTAMVTCDGPPATTLNSW